MRRHEILQYVQTFTEIGLDRQLDGPSRRIRHQSAHTSKLFDLLVGSTGSGIRHHINIIVFIQTGKQHFRQFFIGVVPSLHNRTISLLLRDQSTAEIHGNLIYRRLRRLQHFLFLRGHRHIGNRNRHSRLRGILITG